MIVNGKNYKRTELKKIGDDYYIKNVTCFEINGKWYLPDVIAIDHSTKSYGLKANMIEGYVDGKRTLGWFTPSYRSIQGTKMWMDFNDCDEPLSYRQWATGNHGNRNVYHPYPLSYNFSDGSPYIKNIERKFEEIKLDIHQITKENAWFLKGLSFGMEFETNNGTLPQNVMEFCGLVPLKDGSLRLNGGIEPYEYATVPMRGAKGLQALANSVFFLKHYCTFDTNCSLHVHIGGIRKDKINILSLYNLCYRIQNELFDMVPKYKRDPILYLGNRLPNGDSRKNYAQPLPGLPQRENWKESFDDLFTINSGGFKLCQEVHVGSKHPQGKQKWNHNFRYSAISLQHLLFDNGETVEFRLHPMSLSITNVANWLALCVAIIRYAETNSHQILKMEKTITLESIVDGYATEFGTMAYNTKKAVFAEGLKSYIRETKQRMYSALLENDYLGTNISEDYQNKIIESTFESKVTIVTNSYSFTGSEFVKAAFGKVMPNPFGEFEKAKDLKDEPDEEAMPFFDDDDLVVDAPMLNQNEVFEKADKKLDEIIEEEKEVIIKKVKEIEKKLIENEIVA